MILILVPKANQNNPIWPLIQPARQVDVIFVNDNSADTDEESIGADKDALYNWPNGTEIRHTYLMAKQFGLAKMPFVPDVRHLHAPGPRQSAPPSSAATTRAQTTIVFLPNAPFYATSTGQPVHGQDGLQCLLSRRTCSLTGSESRAQGNAADWALSLACIITHKHVVRAKVSTAHAPSSLKKHCYVA